jgi:hypothetical protein
LNRPIENGWPRLAQSYKRTGICWCPPDHDPTDRIRSGEGVPRRQSQPFPAESTTWHPSSPRTRAEAAPPRACGGTVAGARSPVDFERESKRGEAQTNVDIVANQGRRLSPIVKTQELQTTSMRGPAASLKPRRAIRATLRTHRTRCVHGHPQGAGRADHTPR